MNRDKQKCENCLHYRACLKKGYVFPKHDMSRGEYVTDNIRGDEK